MKEIQWIKQLLVELELWPFDKKSYFNPPQHNKAIYAIYTQPKVYQGVDHTFIFMKISLLKLSTNKSLFGVFDVGGALLANP